MKRVRLWKLLALFTVVLSLLVIGVSFYHYFRRPIQPAQPISGKILSISTQSQEQLIAFMKAEEVVIAVSAVSIDLIKNELKVLFFETENPVMKQVWAEYVAKGIPVTPAFSNIPKTNVHLANIINGDFVCVRFETTYFDAEKIAPWICSMTVPPGFYKHGGAAGFINFHLNRELSDVEKVRYAKAVAEMSVSIYQRDVQYDAEKK